MLRGMYIAHCFVECFRFERNFNLGLIGYKTIWIVFCGNYCSKCVSQRKKMNAGTQLINIRWNRYIQVLNKATFALTKCTSRKPAGRWFKLFGKRSRNSWLVSRQLFIHVMKTWLLSCRMKDPEKQQMN